MLTRLHLGTDMRLTSDHCCIVLSSSGHWLLGTVCLATAAATSATARRTTCTGSWAMLWSSTA